MEINLNHNMENKPRLWVLHNMPRSGGTLVSKCLGVMSSTVLLSEIHPGAQHVESFNALNQAQQWYGLVPELNWQETEFVDAVIAIQKAATHAKKSLVLRDWSHADYLGPPVTQKPTNSPALMNLLAAHFDIRSIQLVRHPLDTWLSLRRLTLIKKNKIDLSQFLTAYAHYLRNTSADCRLVYEDFLTAPTDQLKRVCESVGLPFDEGYENRWFEFDKITGDTSNSSSLRKKVSINPRPRRAYDDIDLDWLENLADYQYLMGEIYD